MKIVTTLVGLLLVCSIGLPAASGESLIVHTVDEKTGKPLSGIPVTIRQNFLEPRRAKKGEVKTVNSDVDGKGPF